MIKLLLRNVCENILNDDDSNNCIYYIVIIFIVYLI